MGDRFGESHQVGGDDSPLADIEGVLESSTHTGSLGLREWQTASEVGHEVVDDRRNRSAVRGDDRCQLIEVADECTRWTP